MDFYLQDDTHIIYLRKSRADNPNESVEEVLQKHEDILQQLSIRDFGGKIPERCIYREVVSGETIDERPEMIRLLAEIENPKLKAVLVVEPQRLSRGDLEDCGRIVNAFRYSGTQIITPNMVYDLSNKMQRKFFEQELMRGNDYLQYTKEILMRGRIASIKRGCYIGNIPPFGYDKVTKDGYCTLEPNADAAAVLLAFQLYVNEDKTFLQIARHFDSLGIKPYKSEIWEKSSIRAMLANQHYIGNVFFKTTHSEKTVQHGEIITHTVKTTDPSEVIIAKGKHPAIVPIELFDAAQAKTKSHPPAKEGFPLKNPFAGLIFCQKCGHAMAHHPYPHARARIECRNRNGCGSKSAPMDEVIQAVSAALELEHLPDLKARLQSNAGSSAAIQKQLIEKMNAELDDLYAKEQRQFDLLESGTYTEDIFTKRNKALHIQIEDLKTKIFEAKKNIPKQIDYAEKIIQLKKAIAALRSNDTTPEQQNRFLKSIIRRIEYEFTSYGGKNQTRYKLHIFLRL